MLLFLLVGVYDVDGLQALRRLNSIQFPQRRAEINGKDPFLEPFFRISTVPIPVRSGTTFVRGAKPRLFRSGCRREVEHTAWGNAFARSSDTARSSVLELMADSLLRHSTLIPKTGGRTLPRGIPDSFLRRYASRLDVSRLRNAINVVPGE